MCRAHGFTIVELVVVIVVLGILSLGTVQFIRQSSEGYDATVVRSELGATARIAVERIARELRNALPNSVRVNAACIELIEADAAATYLNVPTTNPRTTFQSATITGTPPATPRAAVFPDDPSAIYSLANPGPVSPPITFGPAAGNVVQVTMADPHQFAAESPTERWFVIGTPVSFCLDAGRLWRYRGYGFNDPQPLPAALPTAMPGRSAIGDGVAATGAPFSIASATLTRNAIVTIELQFQRDGDQVRMNHQVQLRNVP